MLPFPHQVQRRAQQVAWDGKAPHVSLDPLNTIPSAHGPATAWRTLLGEPQLSSLSHSAEDKLCLATSLTLCLMRFLSTSLVSHFEPAIPTINAPASAPSFRLICSL